MPAQKMEQLAPLRVPENTILAAPARPSQILIHDERDRQLQLAEQRVRQPFDPGPVRRSAALFFREDLTEPKL